MIVSLCFCFSAQQQRRQRLADNDDGPEEPEDTEVISPTSYNPLIFLPPALCDMTATSIQYIGLTLTFASSFQMLRGAVIIFTGILSVIFLRRQFQVRILCAYLKTHFSHLFYIRFSGYECTD